MAGRLADIGYRIHRPGPIPAGPVLSIPQPGRQVWLIRSLTFTLTTSAVVANRLPEVRLDDGAGVYFRSGSNVNQAASLAFTYCAFPGAALAGIGAPSVYIPLDGLGLLLQAGHTLSVVAVNGDAADQFSAVALLVAEYYTGPVAPGLPLPVPYVEAFEPTAVG